MTSLFSVEADNTADILKSMRCKNKLNNIRSLQTPASKLPQPGMDRLGEYEHKYEKEGATTFALLVKFLVNFMDDHHFNKIFCRAALCIFVFTANI